MPLPHIPGGAHLNPTILQSLWNFHICVICDEVILMKFYSKWHIAGWFYWLINCDGSSLCDDIQFDWLTKGWHIFISGAYISLRTIYWWLSARGFWLIYDSYNLIRRPFFFFKMEIQFGKYLKSRNGSYFIFDNTYKTYDSFDVITLAMKAKLFVIYGTGGFAVVIEHFRHIIL